MPCRQSAKTCKICSLPARLQSSNETTRYIIGDTAEIKHLPLYIPHVELQQRRMPRHGSFSLIFCVIYIFTDVRALDSGRDIVRLRWWVISIFRRWRRDDAVNVLPHRLPQKYEKIEENISIASLLFFRYPLFWEAQKRRHAVMPIKLILWAVL